MSETLSLFDLCTQLKRIIALNFPEPLWFTAEIIQCNEKGGHFYLSLGQKDDDKSQLIAQVSAVIWKYDALDIKKKSGIGAQEWLQVGQNLKCLGIPIFHEKFGFQIKISQLDPNFTLGQYEIEKRANLEKLYFNRLHEINKELAFPKVIQRCAVIASSTSAGWIDFKKHLESNSTGQKIELTLFDAIMQGHQTFESIKNQLEKIQHNISEFDIIVIVRGGGSKLDLMAFDQFPLAEKLAHFKLPIITGIGHEIDTSLCDIVAYQSFKTPTAVAEFIQNHNFLFIQELKQIKQKILQKIHNSHSINKLQISQLSQNFFHKLLIASSNQKEKINNTKKNIFTFIFNHLQEEKLQLKLSSHTVLKADPKKVLERGYALVYQDSKHIKSFTSFIKNKSASIRFNDGQINVKNEK